MRRIEREGRTRPSGTGVPSLEGALLAMMRRSWGPIVRGLCDAVHDGIIGSWGVPHHLTSLARVPQSPGFWRVQGRTLLL
jgi:hypothetical protein